MTKEENSFDLNVADNLKMIGSLNNRNTKIEYINSKLEVFFQKVEPSLDLLKVIGEYEGSNIYEKVKSYITFNDYTYELDKAFRAIEMSYLSLEKGINTDKFFDNSLSTHGAKNVEAKKGTKKVFSKHIKEFIAVMIVLAVCIGIPVSYIVGRSKELGEASYSIISKYDKIDSEISYKDGVLFEENSIQFNEYLKSYGFNKYEIIYLTQKYWNETELKNILNLYGYSSFEDFLYQKFSTPILDSNGNVVGKRADYNKFVNNIEEGIKNKAKLINDNTFLSNESFERRK